MSSRHLATLQTNPKKTDRTETLIFAELEKSHLTGGLRMSQDVSWPHRLEDWAFVAGISKGAVALDGTRVVATALATPFGDVGMVNLIIVDTELRGQGLGRKIMQHAMDTISPKVWRLVATREGLPMYEKFGFRESGEILQHQGIVTGSGPMGDAVWATPGDLIAIRAMDHAASGMDRSTLYDALEIQARFVVMRDGASINGFAALRDFGRGKVVGPVVAENLKDAQHLLSLIMADCEGQFLRIDTGLQSGLADWVSQYGLIHAGGGIAMQRGSGAGIPTGPHQIFALASQALG